MKKISLLLALVMILGFTANAFAVSTIDSVLKRNELRCGIDSGYIPFEMTDKTGKFIGFEIDLARELAKAMGVKFVPVNMAFDGIIPALKTDKVDIITAGMTVTQERNLQVNFAEPIITVGQTVIVNKKHEGKVKSHRDLNSPEYTLVAKLGTTGEQAAKRYFPKAHYKSFDTETDAAMAVANGQADAMVYDLPFNALFMADHGAKKLFFLDKPFTYEPIAWGIRKGDPDFLNFINNFMQQIKNDGRYEKLYAKWFKSTNWKKSLQ
ncbi:transporter substrate-binding domain-containing protein [Maridesulfovibrio bastinii]|uniref:transporter substrate-binding domain-containing protein n=1 Tax=Maridesulfovibrio bastinii TaxID=47157 RepID=UPI00040FC020|nr:transporter substrate-binding domain-containing protein [Maridesulfovibrio bastinii]